MGSPTALSAIGAGGCAERNKSRYRNCRWWNYRCGLARRRGRGRVTFASSSISATVWSCACGSARVFFPESQVRVWLHTRPTDMRKSFDGLAVLVGHALGEDPLSRQLFVFINRRRTQMKVLYFDRSGYCVWAKRLERGRFHYRECVAGKALLDWTALKLLEGIEVDRIHRRVRYRYREPAGALA
ncbi:MAG: transposase [Proteobacteria bacterium]|nr:MAG: transposase [Pseudomonadota bacterium]